MSIDMGNFIAPKSDQLNADDLTAGPRTITITGVKANEGSTEQPISISFDGDNNKPFKPCKSMRRCMVIVWGSDASKYVGRSMTLYRDHKVQWGGMDVGGIRISHMSHIEKSQTMALTASKTKRAAYTVQPLVIETIAADAVLLLYAAAYDAKTLAECEEARAKVWRNADKDQKAALKAASDAAKERISKGTTDAS